MERYFEEELTNHYTSLSPKQKESQVLLECVRPKPRMEVLALYLSLGMNTQFETKTNMNLLHILASKKCPDILQMLIEHGANVNGKNNNDEIPLHIASSSGDVKSMIVLINAGSSIHAIDDQGRTPLIRAGHSTHAIEACKTLLDNKADIRITGLEHGRLLGHSIIIKEDPRLINDASMQMGIFSFPDAEGTYPIHLTILLGNIKCVKAFIKHGHDIHLPNDRTGDTPMHYAVRCGKSEILHFLYEHGASEDIPNHENETARELAERMQWPKVIEALESAREEAEIRKVQSSTQQDTIMNTPEESGKRIRKSQKKNAERTEQFKEQMQDIVIFNQVLSMLQSDKAKMSSMRTQLRQLHDYNMSGENKQTLMHLAAIHGCPDLIKYLLGKHANPKLKDAQQRTPLMLAILSGNEQSVKLLMKCYYDVHETDAMNNSLFVLAYWMEMYELAMQFIDEGADDRGLLKGYTPNQKKRMKNG